MEQPCCSTPTPERVGGRGERQDQRQRRVVEAERAIALVPARGPADVNPGEDHASGINQALGPRKPPGYALWSLDQQLDYIIQIDLREPAQAAAYAQLRSARTPEDAAIGASMYERAEGYARLKPFDYYTRKTPVQQVLDEVRRQRRAASPES